MLEVENVFHTEQELSNYSRSRKFIISLTGDQQLIEMAHYMRDTFNSFSTLVVKKGTTARN